MGKRFLLVFLITLFTPLIIIACRTTDHVTTDTPGAWITSETKVASPEPTQTTLPATPTATPTPIPLAALVNGEAISMVEFQAELDRFEASTQINGTILASDTYRTVLDELIDQTLLAQGAADSGFRVDESMLQSKIDSLETQLGSAQALQNWQTAHGYSSEDFRKSLKRAVEAAWMRDKITSAVPETAEQVHVFQILIATAAAANEVYDLLQSGDDFLELATRFEPETRGDLGWFPRGYLQDAAIEQAAFALQPGQHSPVVETEIGFHILFVAERDPSHALQPEARSALQRQTLQEWIRERRVQSEIQILLP